MTTTMLPPGSIVVGVDSTDSSLDAVAWAVSEAVRDRRPLVIAAAAAPPSGMGGAAAVKTEELENRAAARRNVARGIRHAQKMAPEVDPVPKVVTGTPRSVLLELSMDAHLLVVGSRGLGRLSSLVFGSVGVTVASTAHCPVVVLRVPAELSRPDRLIVATDGLETSAAAVEFGFAHAAARDVPLSVVYCYDDAGAGVPFGGLDASGPGPHTSDRLTVSQSVAGMRERYPDVQVEVKVAHGPAAEYLVEASRSAELLVMGSRGHRTAVAGLIGTSVSQQVLEKAHCAVAVVPPTGRDSVSTSSNPRRDSRIAARGTEGR